jgi:hypothetical protein
MLKTLYVVKLCTIQSSVLWYKDWNVASLPMTVGNWREYLTWTLGPRELKKKKLYRVFLKDIVILLCSLQHFIWFFLKYNMAASQLCLLIGWNFKPLLLRTRYMKEILNGKNISYMALYKVCVVLSVERKSRSNRRTNFNPCVR